MAEMPPIDVGAMVDLLGAAGRVVNIWIDEDGTPQLSFDWKCATDAGDVPPESWTYDELATYFESDVAERINDGHDAWKWRNE